MGKKTMFEFLEGYKGDPNVKVSLRYANYDEGVFTVPMEITEKRLEYMTDLSIVEVRVLLNVSAMDEEDVGRREHVAEPPARHHIENITLDNGEYPFLSLSCGVVWIKESMSNPIEYFKRRIVFFNGCVAMVVTDVFEPDVEGGDVKLVLQIITSNPDLYIDRDAVLSGSAFIDVIDEDVVRRDREVMLAKKKEILKERKR